MNPMPRGWVEVSLGEITDSAQQGGPLGSLFAYVDISSIDADTKRIVSPKQVHSAEAPSRARQRLKARDVVVSMTRPNLNAVAIIPPGLDGAIGSTGLHVLRSTASNPQWLFYAVQSLSFVEEMVRLVQGALYPAVRPKDIRAHRIPLPPLAEQGRIISTIEERLSSLDAAVASLERVRAVLPRYRAAVLKAACEGQFTSNGHRNSTRGARVAQEYDRELPRGWTRSSLGRIKTQSLYGPRFSSDYYTSNGVLVVRTSDISEGGKINVATAPRLRLSKNEFERYRLVAGDILITRTGSLGTVAVFDDQVKAIPGAYLIRYRLSGDITLSRYVALFLRSPLGLRMLLKGGAGVGRPNLNAPTIDAIPIPLPPSTEQAPILAEVDRRLSLADAADRAVSAGLAKAKRLRQAILKRAFEGKLVPQDPNDEPASVVLKRIRRGSAEAPA